MTVSKILLFGLLAFAQGASAVTDPQILAIVETANQLDVDGGKLAKTSQNPEVTAFAQHMVTDHGAANTNAQALAKKLGI